MKSKTRYFARSATITKLWYATIAANAVSNEIP